MPSTSNPRCCWNARTAWSSSSSNRSTATRLPVVRSSSGLSITPNAASAARLSVPAPPTPPRAARISVPAPPRSPRRRLDILDPFPAALRAVGCQRPTALTRQRQLGSIVADGSGFRENPRRLSGPRIAALDHVSELAQQFCLAFRADDPLHRSAVLYQDQRRDGHHLEVARGRGVGVDVKLGHREGTCLLVG